MGFLSSENKSETKGADQDGVIGNQSNNVNNSYNNQTQLANALYGNQGQAIGNQATLGEMLLAQSQGQGPNPAQQQYQNNVGQIAQQQAGAIASAKGISPALAAQLMSQQGGQAMQNAAGNSAVLQAQQQLAAQQQLGALTGQQIGQQQNAYNAAANTALGGQSNVYGFQHDADALNQNTQGQNAAMRTQGIQAGFQALAGAGQLAAGGGGGGGAKPSGGSAGTGVGMYTGGSIGAALMAGGQVPGQAPLPGDHPHNDTVHAMLSPGEVVIPRSIAHDPEAAKLFIEHLMKDGPGVDSYGAVLKARRGKK
jgi:hypothetical protein